LSGARAPEFSIATSGALVAVAFGETPVGIDIERSSTLTEPTSEFAKAILSQVEREELARLPEDCHETTILKFWVRKEAVLKAAGLGLAVAPSRVHVGVDARSQTYVERTSQWYDVALIDNLPEGYVGAVASTLANPDIKTFHARIVPGAHGAGVELIGTSGG
jgi:4'-phosphopantetheinyl transferase